MLLLLLFFSFAFAFDGCATALSADITTSFFDSEILPHPRFPSEWSDEPSSFVAAISKKKSLYISQDDGVTWSQALNNDTSRLPRPSDADPNALLQIVDMHFTTDPARFYVRAEIDTQPFYYTTIDGGRTFRMPVEETHEWKKNRFYRLYPHRTLPNVAMGWSWVGDTYVTQTWITTDLGESWVSVGTNTSAGTEFSCWTAGCGEHWDAVLYRNAAPGHYNDCQTGECELVRQHFDATKPSKMSLGEKVTVFENCTRAAAIEWWGDGAEQRILVASTRHVSPNHPDDIQMKVHLSTDELNWQTLQFPFGTTPHQYRFIPTRNDVLLAGVRPVGVPDSIKYGDLYVSSNGDEKFQFVESLRYVVLLLGSELGGHLEVTRSVELDGILLANRYRTSSDGSPDLSCVQTVITKDYGNTWGLLEPPANLRASNCTAEKDCAVHLVMNTWPATAYSPPNSVGMWISQGNVGECLNDDHAETFVSNDAGSSWSLLAPERAIYSMADQGGLIVAAATDRATTDLFYSRDFGETVQQCTLTIGSSMDVFIIVSRSDDSYVFYVVGPMAGPNQEASGAMVRIKMNNDNIPVCGPNDYADWSPGPCLLGKNVVFARRKADSLCRHYNVTEVVSKETSCACTEDDYDCDFCFERFGTKCTLINTPLCKEATSNTTAAQRCAIKGQKNYFVTDGYRLEPNNACQGGVQHGELIKCQENEGSTGGGNTIAIVMIILAVGLLIAAALAVSLCVYMRRQKSNMMYGELNNSEIHNDDL